MILHLVSKADWDEATKDKPFVPKDFDRSGFIHCTHGDPEMLAVANRFYKSQPGDFLVIHIDEAKVSAPVKWEAPAHPDQSAPKMAGTGALKATDGDLQKTESVRARDFDDSHIAAHLGKPVGGTSLPPAAESHAPASDEPVSAASLQPAVPSPEPQAPNPKAPSQQPLFPHIYGPLNRNAIMGMRRMLRDQDGTFTGYAPIDETAPYDPDNPLNLKKPSQLAQELLDATDGVSDAMKRLKDRIEGRMSEIDEKMKKL